MTKAQAAALRDLYSKLVKQPAEEIRAVAVEQRDKLSSKLGKAKDLLGSVLQRWKVFDDSLEAVSWHLAEGDKLKAKTDEASREERRRQYARAFMRGQSAAQDLDAEVSEGGTAVLVLRASVEAAGNTIVTVARKAEELADSAGNGLVIGLALGGLALGGMWALSQRRRGRYGF